VIALRVYFVVAAFFALGAVLMGIQRRPRPGTTSTAWAKYASYAVLLTLMLAAAQVSGALYAMSCALIVLVGLYELLSVAGTDLATRATVVGGALLIGVAALIAGHPTLYATAVATCLGTLALGSMARDPQSRARDAVWGVVGLIAIATPGAHLLLLAERAERFALFAFLFLVVCCADAFAELIGRRWPLGKGIIRVSPGKSLSGLIAGLAAGVLMAVTLSAATGVWRPGRAAAYGLALGVAAVLGDLIASSLKRAIGTKDFGTTLPGHGGVLDRFDSLIFAAWPFYWMIRG